MRHPPADLQSFIKERKMERIKIDRINELARISKTRPLTEAGQKEQKALRDEYIAEFRAGIRGVKEEKK